MSLKKSIFKIIISLLSLVAIYYLYPFIVPNMVVPYGSFEWAILQFRYSLAAVIIGRLAMDFLPEEWGTKIQTFTILISFVLFRIDFDHWGLSVLSVLFPALFVCLLCLLPFNKKSWRTPTVILSTLSFPILVFFVLIPLKSTYFFNFSIIGSAMSFLLIACSLNQFGEQKPKGAIIRAMFTNFVSRGPIPLENCLKLHKEKEVKLKGLLWLLLGIFIFFVVSRLPMDETDMFLFVTKNFNLDNSGKIIGASFLSWVIFFGKAASTMFMDCGLLLVLGISVHSPINKPWLATNYAEYWQRANTFRYEFLKRVYLPYVARFRGVWVYIGIVGIFMISSVHHYFFHHLTPYPFLRWFIEGVVTAGTIWWIRKKNKIKISHYQEQLDKPKEPSRAFNYFWQGVCVFITLATHGFLFILNRQGFR